MAARTTAHGIFATVQEVARDELRRSSLGLAFSGLSAGLNIGFSFVAVGAVLVAFGDTSLGPLAAAAAYPIGFVLIIVARAQLFTENTLTPVLLILHDPSRAHLGNTARLWAVVLAANLMGAFLFSLALAGFTVAPHVPHAWLVATAQEAYHGTWGQLFLQAIFGGWLIALLVWSLHAGTNLIGEIVLIWIVAFVIQAAGFSHSVAGAVEILYLVHRGLLTYGAWAWNFQIPVTLGNIIGGVVFVALVNYGQVVGAGRDVERAERSERIRELKDDRGRVAEERREELEAIRDSRTSSPDPPHAGGAAAEQAQGRRQEEEREPPDTQRP